MISKLKFDYDFEAFFPHEDPETEFYLNFRKDFETDNDFFIVVLENKEGVFQYDFLEKVDSLTSVLSALPNVTYIQGPTRLVEFVKDPFIGTVFTQPILRWKERENYIIDSSKVFSTPGLVDVFFSEDGKSVAINMKHKQRMSKAACDQLSIDVEKEVSKFSFDGTHVIGRALGQRIYVEMMVRELAMFISISLLLTVIFLFIAFRSGWGIIIPTLVVIISILWTLGAMKLLGKDIDLMITILPTIIFVVGMSDSVHVLTKYLQELRNGRDKYEAIKYAFKSIRLATFLTALTTSVGFLTLMLSDIKPVSDFGLYTSIGVMLAYGLTFTMLPAILLLAKPKRLYAFSTSEDFWSKKLHRVFLWIIRRRKQVFIGGLITIAFGLFGISQLVVDNMMLEDLRDDHLLKREFRYMEEHYSGVRPFELAIFPKKGIDPFQREFLSALDSLDHFLESSYGVGAEGSLATLVKTFNKASNGGQLQFYSIPEQDEIDQIKKILRRKSTREYLELFYNDSSKVLRITGKVGDIGRLYYEEKNRQLAQFISQNKLDTRFDYKVTGTAHLIDLNNQSLVDNMLADLLLSVLVVGLIMAVIYRSWKMLFLTVIPNIIPLLLVGGLMGYVGIPIKISTSIIFNIAFGIAVDDTIHFLARVRTLLGEGLSLPYSVKRTFLTTGKAMIITTLILCGGFMTLILSNFLGTYYIGFLITLTLIIGVITELLFAPLILLFFFRKK
jgi:predicted RND superfamily exporter protein